MVVHGAASTLVAFALASLSPPAESLEPLTQALLLCGLEPGRCSETA